jgi:hypothetical protein
LAAQQLDPPTQSPGIPLVIGLALTGLVAGTTRWLGRRYGW